VAVEYAAGYALLGERFFFDGSAVAERVRSEASEEVATPDMVEFDPRLLRAALEWLRADVFRDFDTHRQMLHPDAEMFGARGADEVLAFKKRFLTQSPAYEIPAVTVDVKNRVVVAEFTCLIPGKEGKGTDIIAFDDDFRVRKVTAVRHATMAGARAVL
jgi:hypothetical protein